MTRDTSDISFEEIRPDGGSLISCYSACVNKYHTSLRYIDCYCCYYYFQTTSVLSVLLCFCVVWGTGDVSTRKKESRRSIFVKM